MTWTPDLSSLLQQFAAEYPAPTAGDNSARDWILNFAQQVCYSLGGYYGTKSTSASSPQTKDVLAYRTSTNLYGWDLLYASGSSDCRVVFNPETMDITGQTFIPVEPINHLALDPPTPPPVPPVPDAVHSTLVSQNGTYTMGLQDDGNLVIYRAGQPIWASGSNQK